MTKRIKQPKLMVYDIETTPLKSWHFSFGEQALRHGSVDKVYNKYEIICLSYMFDTDKKPVCLHWGENGEGSANIIKKFDKVIKYCQDHQIVIIGKNNKRFDDKHINTHQWLTKGEPMPEWASYTDDLESQLRRHFYLPSYSLDYISSIRGLGGKTKMELQDWIDNMEYKMAQRLRKELGIFLCRKISKHIFGRPFNTIYEAGRAAFDKMCLYNCKDVTDTMSLVLELMPYCKFKNKLKEKYPGELRCQVANCGSTKLRKNGKRTINGSIYQSFYCNEHCGYAGRAIIKKNGDLGKMTK